MTEDSKRHYPKEFFIIPMGTKIAFENPPEKHGRTKVWAVGRIITPELMELRHRSRYGSTVTLKEWREWGGYIHARKPKTARQRERELLDRIEHLEKALKEKFDFVGELGDAIKTLKKDHETFVHDVGSVLGLARNNLAEGLRSGLPFCNGDKEKVLDICNTMATRVRKIENE